MPVGIADTDTLRGCGSVVLQPRETSQALLVPDAFELPQRLNPGTRPLLAGLAEQQEGVARRDQLYGCREVVVVMHNGALARRQQMWAAILNAGHPAALAARTAVAERFGSTALGAVAT